MRLFPLLLFCLLAACSPDNVSGRYLVPDADIFAILPANPALLGAVHVEEASVGDYEYKSFAPITPYGLTEGMHLALRQANWLAPENSQGKYQVETRLLSIKRDGIFTDTCTSRIQYQLLRKGDIVDDQIVQMPGTVRWLDEPNGDQRVRDCIILSVRENITHYMNVLARLSDLPTS